MPSISADSLDELLEKLTDSLESGLQQVAKKRQARRLNNFKKLEAAKEALAIEHEFKVGDFVDWKEGLQLYGRGPFLITEIMSVPITDRQFSNIAAYGEPHTIVALAIDSDGDALRILLPAARMQPYTPDQDESSDSDQLERAPISEAVN